MLENIDLTKAPQECGVYFFKDVSGEIIYIGSSNNLYNRMTKHNSCIRNGSAQGYKQELYQFLQSNQFTVEYRPEEKYRQLEQKLIEKYAPKFNQNRAYTGCGGYKGRSSEWQREYNQKYMTQYNKNFQKTHREEIKTRTKKYSNQKCCYKGEILTLCALKRRFEKQGIPHPTLEAKKYLITTN